MAELEFDKVKVEVADPLEQLPSADGVTVTSITGQLTVLGVAVVYDPEDGFESPDRT